MNIYSNFRPTYLYIKQHNVTGLKYFGKTIKKDPIKYKGSGDYWLNHLAVHGNDVTTTWYQLFTDIDELKAFALEFSKENNIVESNEWANLIVENGLHSSGRLGRKASEQQKLLQSEKMKGRFVGEKNSFFGKTHSPETIQKYKDLFTGVPLSESRKKNISKGLKGKSTWNKGVQMSSSAKQKSSLSLSGRITVNNGSINKRIKPETLEEFLSQGWIKGKLIKSTPH